MVLNTHGQMKFFGAAFALFVLASVGVHNEAHGAVTNLSNADPNASTKIDEKQALAISQAAIGRKIGDYVFRDTHGKRVKLSDFQGQPLVISMIYTSCHDVCPIITSTIQSVDSIARDALGDDSFKIITIGFDSSSDSPTRMQSFARKNGIRLSDHWRFLSGDLESVSRLSNDIGFQFFESPKGFDHLTQTTIVDAKGRVFQQIYGETFQTPNFVDPLKNLVFGTSVPFASLGDLINKVRLFCTIYDPASDQYHFKYSMFFRMFVGASVILSMMTFIGKWLWQNRRSAKKPPPHFKTQP